MSRAFCLAIRPWGGLAALLGLFLWCTQSLPAQDGEATVTLRDAEGYEVPDQGWVKSPSFLLDQGDASFTPTVMDIADNADFDNPTTWSLTDKGGTLLHTFNPHESGICPGIEAPLRFNTNDTWISSTGRCPFFTARTNTQTGEKGGTYGNGSSGPGGIWFRHGGEEVIVWGYQWGLVGNSTYEEYGICVFDASTKERLNVIGAPESLGGLGVIGSSPVGNFDGSRLYILYRGYLCVLDIDSEQVIKMYDQSLTPCKVSRDGTRLMVWNTDGTTDLIDTMTDEIIHTFEDLPPIDYFDAATGNHNVLIVFENGTCRLMNTEKAFPVTPLDFVCDETNTLRLSRNGIVIAKISSPEGMRLYDLEMNNYLDFYSSYNFQDFSHDGTLIVGLGTGRFYSFPSMVDCNVGKIETLPPQFIYQSGDLTNGPRTVYVRLRDDEGTSKVLTYNYNLDTVGPNAPAKQTAQGGQSGDGRVTFTWSPVGDTAGGSGVANYDFIVESAEGACDVHHAFSDGTSSVTVHCPTGQVAYFRVRAIDLAGNAGAWSESVAYYVNAAPEAPSISLNPASPLTLDTVTVRASATDPEGDAIIDTGAQWYRGGVLQSEEDALDPALTAKGQIWTCRARVRDFHGAWSDFSEQTFTIGNTLPSQPIVEIKPDPARADSDLIVDVMQYSIDPDGDTVAYDFMWFKSTDGGETWIHKVELDGSPQVSNLFINDGELWRVQYTPYEKVVDGALAESADKVDGKAPALNRADGYYAWDQVFVGENHPPAFAFGDILLSTEGQDVNADVAWTIHDADGDAFTVNMYCFDVDYPVLMPVQLFIEQGTDGYQGTIPITSDRNFRLVAIVTDAKGSVTQVISSEQSVKTATRSTWVIYQ